VLDIPTSEEVRTGSSIANPVEANVAAALVMHICRYALARNNPCAVLFFVKRRHKAPCNTEAFTLAGRLSSHTGFAHKIGIVTPYKAQQRQLERTFAACFGPAVLSAVEIATVDGFQVRNRNTEKVLGVNWLVAVRRTWIGCCAALC
jgi:hypothetical protein